MHGLDISVNRFKLKINKKQIKIIHTFQQSCLDPRLVQDTTVLPIHMCQSCVDELPKDVVEQLNYVVRRIERMELYCENEVLIEKDDNNRGDHSLFSS